MQAVSAAARLQTGFGLRVFAAALSVGLMGIATLQSARAQEHGAPAAAAKAPAAAAPEAKASATSSAAKAIGNQVRAAVEAGIDKKPKTLTVEIPPDKVAARMRPAVAHGAAPAEAPAMAGAMHVPPGAIANPAASRQYIRARAAALTGQASDAPAMADAHAAGGEVHWSYQGADGPQAWAQLKPDFNLCAAGKRQSPINIEDSNTLRGPAEPIQFDYTPSSASVFNNGHTVQVDIQGDNAITVRGSNFRLLQFHFHHPSEERVNSQSFAMVAHLVHRNNEGQLAVVAVLLEPGDANPVINKVWTYMPLDANDRVQMPRASLELANLLPKDQRYYQFIGSLTTPPCSENVLWMVLKQPVTVSREQLRLFGQLFPNNARPVQPINARAVRSAQ